jgi:hypothetical protein
VAIVAESNTYYDNIKLLEKVLGRAEQWAKRHAARFAPDKFELIHFTNPSENDINQEPTITNIGSDIYDFITQHPEGNDLMPV